MGRLIKLQRDALTEEQGRYWDGLVNGQRGARVLDDAGTLSGPFHVLLYSPQVGRHLSRIGETLRFGSGLSARIVEIVILTATGRWGAEFAWARHARLARQAGISDGAIEMIRRGDEPVLADDAERVAYGCARSLVTAGGIPDALYDEARAIFSVQQVVDLVALCGYYTTMSFLLNGFLVDLSTGG